MAPFIWVMGLSLRVARGRWLALFLRAVFLLVATFCFIAAISVMPLADALANTPTIRLFPTTVVEDLQQTSTVAREMESGLQEVIGRLDQQQLLYLESKCEGAENDPNGSDQ